MEPFDFGEAETARKIANIFMVVWILGFWPGVVFWFTLSRLAEGAWPLVTGLFAWGCAQGIFYNLRHQRKVLSVAPFFWVATAVYNGLLAAVPVYLRMDAPYLDATASLGANALSLGASAWFATLAAMAVCALDLDRRARQICGGWAHSLVE